ncbi:hypothetical protein BROUX41_005875 [Berkeleyomyces rouxiae]|uniref:uncharacterized protein n=1 Tax=Berkeleyomyces rouxiae TaxID=2035830 RepID=UPI003B7CA190
MSVFSRSTFSSVKYAHARPHYPATLVSRILSYHGANSPRGSLIDIGCGPGTAAIAFSSKFDRIIGVDPSERMISQTSSLSTTHPQMSFCVSPAEDLSLFNDAVFDMAVAGQSAHWFSNAAALNEIARIVRRGGTFAFWGYNDNIIVSYPAATAVFHDFLYRPNGEVAPGMHSMGRYWEQPGRGILRDYLEQVVLPQEHWSEVTREIYRPDLATCEVRPSDGEQHQGFWLQKRMTLGEFEAYVRTYSAFSAWRDSNPQFVGRAEGGRGDIIDVMMDRMREVTEAFNVDNWREIEVDAVWGTVLVMAKKK